MSPRVAGTIALSSRDGTPQLAMGWNLTKYQRLGEDGTDPEPSEIDIAIFEHIAQALCPTAAPPATKAGADARQRVLPAGLLGVDLPPQGTSVAAR